MKNKLLILIFTLIGVTNVGAETNIIIDKKKTPDVLYSKQNLSMGNMKISNFSIYPTDTEFVIFKGTNLRNNLSKTKSYDFSAELRQTDESIVVKELVMNPVENDRTIIKFSGELLRDSIKSSSNFVELLDSTDQYSLNIKGKSNNSEVFNIFNLQEPNGIENFEITENFKFSKKDNIYTIDALSLNIEKSFNISFNGVISYSDPILTFISGKLFYDFKDDSELSTKIIKTFGLKSKGTLEFKNDVFDLSEHLK
jgi:hypothetical protein